MSSERDITRIVRSWLKEPANENADRVLDSVLDQLDTTPQRRAGWPARRFPNVLTYARFGLVAAAVVAAVAIGIGLFGNSVGPPGVPTPAPSSSPSPPLVTGPIVGTWAAGETTCEQQLAAIEAAGYSAKQMTRVGVDLSCQNGITVEGAEWSSGSQFTIRFYDDGRFTLWEDGVRAGLATYRLTDQGTFEFTDAHVRTICTTYRYAIDGDQLTIEMTGPGCAATGDAPLLDQIAQTVFFETSPFTRQP
jgi:hypothetical protein